MWQARLDVQEKKRQEGTLRQAVGSTSQAASSLVPWSAKKYTIVCPQAQETISESDETFEVEGIESCENVEPIMLPIIEEVDEEEEEEEEIATNLRRGFHE